ncbi:MAG: PepSY-associated TM helix domain-containing protein [Sphingomicrobium sp.]
MRTYHRWLSVLFGVFILFIAVTGVLSQIGSLVNNGGFEAETRERGARQASAVGSAVGSAIVAPAQAHEHEEAAPLNAAASANAAAAPAAFACPTDMTCRPKRVARPGDWDLGFLHHIHSGEQFGPVGVILSLLSGVALIFFAFSGLYMYIQMFRRRARRHSHPKRIFW